MVPFPRKCGACRVRAVEMTILPAYSSLMEHDGRKYEVTVRDLTTPQCASCGAVMLDDDAQERLYDALRQAVGLLTPEQIRSAREPLGLTQVQMAEILKVGASTISRWETGGQIQERVMDLLLRGFFEVPEFRKYLQCPVAVGERSQGNGTMSVGVGDSARSRNAN